MARRRLLIIGGGFAGLAIATGLSDHLNVTLVDSKAYFEYTPGILRCLVDPEHLAEVTRSYADIAARFHFAFLQAVVEELSEHTALVKADEEVKVVEFDFVAVCCGSGYEEPIRPRNGFEDTLADRQVNIEEWREDIKQCQKVLIVGGGTVGVELAGEIITSFPEKQLTLVTSDTRLMKELPVAASTYAHVFLSTRQVRVEYSRRMTEEEMKEFDLVFRCTGIQLRSNFLKTHFSHVLTERGAILVNHALQVQGYTHIFAAGDCAATPISEPKTAYFAEETAKIVAKNIRAVTANTRLTELPELEHFPMTTSVSLGPDFAITVFNSLVLGGRAQTYLKRLLEKLKMRALTSWLASVMWRVSHMSALCVNKIVA